MTWFAETEHQGPSSLGGLGQTDEKLSERHGPPTPSAAVAAVFGDSLPLMRRYAEWLADAGVVRGLLGPREVPRLWVRHLVNCASVASLLHTTGSAAAVGVDAHPQGEKIVVEDIGSGAGLPGLVIAVLRPDVQVRLVEPLLRRVEFLAEVVADLKLGNVEVVRSRVEEYHVQPRVRYVTARAVAPLGRLLEWSLPRLMPGGQLLAIKGESAVREVADAAEVLARWRVVSVDVLTMSLLEDEGPVTIVRVVAGSGDASVGHRRPDYSIARALNRQVRSP